MRVLLILSISIFSAGVALAAPPADPKLTRSDLCGDCHRDIYHMWRGSAHAGSMENLIFLHSFRMSQENRGAASSRICLYCHAPAVSVNADWDLSEKITWDGVGCDICHSLVSVDMSGPGPRMTLDPGPVKRGPIKDAVSPDHEVAYSELHRKALACAPCHDFVNEEGTPIMTTYAEWRVSSARDDGITCQACHMSLTKGNVVDPKVKRVAHTEVNVHEVPGGHSLDQLYKALDVDFDTVREGDELSVDVHITNKGAGHAVPTGMPNRRIMLTVAVDAGQAGRFEDRREFAKTFVDSAGNKISEIWRYFERGTRLESDTRIAPDAKQTESFHFKVPETAIAYLTVRFEYEHLTEIPESEPDIFTFYSERRMLRPDSN